MIKEKKHECHTINMHFFLCNSPPKVEKMIEKKQHINQYALLCNSPTKVEKMTKEENI